MRSTIRRTLAALAALAVPAVLAGADAAHAQSTADEIAKYRDALQDGNPA